VHPVDLRRVVANLLANATRAAGPSGTVTIEVGCRDGGMLIVVEDSGPGFGRLSGRSGLGLSAAARQAVKHQGRLECGRGNLGGARVSLWLQPAPAQMGGRTADATCSV
jgi:signal transduction histidine kinase